MNRDCEKQMSDRPPLPFVPLAKVFEVYTDGSSTQLGAVITQQNRPIAFLVENCLQRNKHTV